MNDEFLSVARRVKRYMPETTDDQKLFMYGLYKQAMEGDCPMNCIKRGIVEGKKHDAWHARRGTEKSVAMKMYIEIANAFLEKVA